MTYLIQNVAAVTDIPAAIAAFAAARGWTVAGTTITRPGGGRSFAITASIGGANNREHRLEVTNTVDADQKAITQMPWRDGTSANPIVRVPTRVHLFGNNTPHAPGAWLACVIECGFNHYRHVYIGNVAKTGVYNGGEVVAANCWWPNAYANLGGVFGFDADQHQYLMAGCHDLVWPDERHHGGAFVDVAANAQTYRAFKSPNTGGLVGSFDGSEVIGGAQDGVSGALVRRGVSDFSGAQILHPYDLYVADSAFIGANARFRYIGYAPGARMVNMRGVEPGAAVTIGATVFRAFPEFSKRIETAMPYGTARPDGGAGGYYPESETSHHIGVAYLE